MTAPWSVQVELVEGCNRICGFCGINAIRSKPGNYNFMQRELAEHLALQLGCFAPLARYEFAMHGEPLKHPDYMGLLHLFRMSLPAAQFQVTTNGIALLSRMQAKLDELFEVVDFVVLDTYYPERDKLRREAATLQRIDVVDFYDDWVPKGISPWTNFRRKLQRTVVLMDDLQARDGEVKSRVIVNHAGNNPTKPVPREPLKKTCTLPFRELSICWNGDVNICCQDWTHAFVCGNGSNQLLDEIWAGARFEAARAHLQNKQRTFAPCDRCDIGSGARSGLLPPYPSVTDEQRALVQAQGLVQLRRQ